MTYIKEEKQAGKIEKLQTFHFVDIYKINSLFFHSKESCWGVRIQESFKYGLTRE